MHGRSVLLRAQYTVEMSSPATGGQTANIRTKVGHDCSMWSTSNAFGFWVVRVMVRSPTWRWIMTVSRIARSCAAKLVEYACHIRTASSVNTKRTCLHGHEVLSWSGLNVLARSRRFELEQIDCACTVETFQRRYKVPLRCRYQQRAGIWPEL